MSHTRRLQQDIDRVLKKVSEGIAEFAVVWEKVQSATNQNLKEKYEADLKKEIKKLQKFRDQIKNWTSSNDVKNKKPLLQARKDIETEMERFKVLEKQTKTKAFSKEGLQMAAKMNVSKKSDPRDAHYEWITEMQNQLNELIEDLEEKRDNLGSGKLKGKAKQEYQMYEDKIKKHSFHIERLGYGRKRLEKKQIALSQVDEIKEDVEFYISDHAELDYFEDEYLYEVLEDDPPEGEEIVTDEEDTTPAKGFVMDDEPIVVVPKKVVVEEKAPVSKKKSRKKSESNKNKKEVKKKEKTKKKEKATPLSPMKPILPPAKADSQTLASIMKAQQKEQQQQQLQQQKVEQNVYTQHRQQAVADTPTEQPRVAAVQNVQPQPPLVQSQQPPQPQNVQQLGRSQSQPVHNQVQAQAAQQQQLHQLLQLQRQIPQQILQQNSAQQQGQVPLQQQQQQGLQQSLQQSLPHPNAQQQQGGLQQQHNNNLGPPTLRPLVDPAAIQALKMLQPSMQFMPDKADSERSTTYVPRNPYRTPSYFPSTPARVFEDPKIFEKFSIDTLFFIFYFQQGTPHQYLGARELKKQSWRYHKKWLTWFQRHEDPKATTDDYEQGTYVYFDFNNGWCQRIKPEFTFDYKYLEDELSVPHNNHNAGL